MSPAPIALDRVEISDEPLALVSGRHVAIDVDVVIAADLIHRSTAGAAEGLARAVRRTGALQRYVRGSRRAV